MSSAGLGFWQVTAAASVHGGDSEAVSGPARSGGILTRGGEAGGSSWVPAPDLEGVGAEWRGTSAVSAWEGERRGQRL